MTRRVLSAADLSYELEGLSDRQTYLTAAAACLHATVGGDVVGWNDLDLASGSAEVWADPPDGNISGEALAPVMDEHPLVRRYLAEPEDVTPKRISDCVSDLEWRSHKVYSELFVPMKARHQLTIVVRRLTPSSGCGWAINRSTSDFDDDEVARAAALQPVLALLDACHRPPTGTPDGRDESEREQARQRARITPRELDILTLVAQGHKAEGIARLRRISVGTVRKHLEHVYDKLGCHDRLMAVDKARRLGML
jgi:DNA-binding CsgD family transcriptional regulator